MANAVAEDGSRSLILATDLDGTFAGGTSSDRELLQQTLARLRGAVLIYVTGRNVPATRDIIRELALPHPDLLIADVGTSVRQGKAFEPVMEVEAELDGVWPGADTIRERLKGVEGLEEQDVRAPRRVSYWIRGGSMDEAIDRAAAALGELNLDLVASAGIYLDVLPPGVNKGTTLRRVLRWLERGETDVVVAGDTLNDLALFETGLCGVVVGNCEAALRERVAGREHLYFAAGEGAAGILEGLRHFGWLKSEGRHGQ
jgi:hydroxymethylpyrimidine pyrophosphatase-like HAD family hydrolase